nr:DNA translocase FtsK 4TM domain-containing protein [Blochmannia endosymbiont of Camponotus (Colobopsis) obliquus]
MLHIFFFWKIFFKSNSIDFFVLSFRIIGALAVLLSLCGLMTITIHDFNYFGSGGAIGDIVSRIILLQCGSQHTICFMLFILIIGMMLCTNFLFWNAICKIFYLLTNNVFNKYEKFYSKNTTSYYLYSHVINQQLIIILFKRNKVKSEVFSFFCFKNKNFAQFKSSNIPNNNAIIDLSYVQILDNNVIVSNIHKLDFVVFYKDLHLNTIRIITNSSFSLKKILASIVYCNFLKNKMFFLCRDVSYKINKFSYKIYLSYNSNDSDAICSLIFLHKHKSYNNILNINKKICHTNHKAFRLNMEKYKNNDKRQLICDVPVPILPILNNKINQITSGVLTKDVHESYLDKIARLIEIKLADYHITASVINILSGPVITRFELDLAAGVKIARIINISRDLARSLSVSVVKVIEVIPGKPYIGLEIPNNKRQIVSFQELLNCDKFRYANSPLTLIFGKDIVGQPVINDLKNLIHILIAGTTGSGKSVGVNVMILSILYKATPEEVRFILIDPKMLELSVYSGIPHLLMEVVTDMKDVDHVLNWCIKEMEYRYQLMSILGVRNLINYNERISQANHRNHPIDNPLYNSNNSYLQSSKKFLDILPYIIIIIDEFSDLIMASGKKIEELIIRLSQKSRAAGIHLILATQRPSVNVITGLIKANIPTRVAFSVSSKIDSRTILDQNGAEMLLGRGDMLYLPAYSSVPIRVHGAFVQEKEIETIVNTWKNTN